jgi:hypothetical protein
MKRNKEFYILSIDGGGIRGVFPAYILDQIEKSLGISLLDKFQMFAGTSTGSIIATAIVCGVPLEKVLNLYKKYGPEIFPGKIKCLKFDAKYKLINLCLKYPIKFLSMLKSMFVNFYKKDCLTELLNELVGETKLGEIKIPLLIPATNIGEGIVHVFKSPYHPDFIRDGRFTVKDAVLASCSAPIYFTPEKTQEYLLADGGLWANNPTLAAVMDAKRRLGVDIKNIRVLSIGTGHQKTSYGVNPDRMWGLMTGWKREAFVNFIFSLQSKTTENYLGFLLDKSQILRINFDSDKDLPLDDSSEIDNLISRADTEFAYRSAEIKKFFAITVEEKEEEKTNGNK